MPANPEDFKALIDAIRVSNVQIEACRAAANEVHQRLQEDAETREVIVTVFLQGSARRGTNIRAVNGKKSDVDLVVATVLDESEHFPPALAWERFGPFLRRTYGPVDGRWRAQDRSVRLFFPGRTSEEEVELDLVLTSAPSLAVQGLLKQDTWLMSPDYDPLALGDIVTETVRKAQADSADWKFDPLRIPDRKLKEWQDTHPLAQIQWARQKNASTNGHFTQIVQALKWWQRRRGEFDRPKGFTLEAIVGVCCPNGVTDLGSGIASTLAEIERRYGDDVRRGITPEVADVGTGLDVLSRIDAADFAKFYRYAADAARIADAAMSMGSREKACLLWRILFGDAFPDVKDPAPPPKPPPKSSGSSGSSGGFTPPAAPAAPKPSRFA